MAGGVSDAGLATAPRLITELLNPARDNELLREKAAQ